MSGDSIKLKFDQPYDFQYIICLAAFFLIPLTTYCQVKAPEETLVKKDSSQIYKDIQKFAHKRKLTYWLFLGVFREIKNEIESSKMKIKNPKNDNYKKLQGKIIRNIKIVTIDPLGLVQGDTIAFGNSWLEKTGNKLHVTTHQRTIKNQLLFEKGEALDSFQLIESERLLRQFTYLSEVKIKPQIISKKNDSIDVIVTVRDLWTINGSANVSATSNKIFMSEDNFLGLSHQIRNVFTLNPGIPHSFTSAGSYLIPNINKTFISGMLYYNSSFLNKGIGINFDRGFFSPLTKWAGGVNVNTSGLFRAYPLPDNTIVNLPANVHAEDIWLGRSFSMQHNNSNAYKDPRILLTGRISNVQYLKRPSFEYDKLKANQGNIFYLSSISYSTRAYYKDRNIYRFGRIEDVPEGKLLALIVGVQKREFFSSRFYSGLKTSYGKHINNLGYLASNVEYGTFIEKGIGKMGVVNAGMYFFNDLWSKGKWSMRQFVDFHLTLGMNREANESININGSNGLFGFNSNSLKGQNRAVLTLANQIYLPVKFIGFQFASFVFASFASIGQTDLGLRQGRVYQGYGIGLLVRNEFLVVNTFQLSIGYYPEVPGYGNNVFKFNPLSVSDLKFNALYFSKPDFVGYY